MVILQHLMKFEWTLSYYLDMNEMDQRSISVC